MVRKKKMKKVLILYILIIAFSLVGCSKNIERLQYEKIDAPHLVSDDSISSYMLIKSSPNEEGKMVYNLTIYSDFLKGTGRYYHYYQVDYKLLNDKIMQYYHIFTYEETERKYAQKFAPHEMIDGIKEFNVAINYEYKLDSEEVINKVLKYHEDIIGFKVNIDYFNGNNGEFIVNLDKVEEENKYKFGIDFSETSGHFDFQAFIETSYGEVYPFYGIYHYELQRGNYSTITYEKVDESIKIKAFYYILNYYSSNNEEYSTFAGIINN